MFPISIIQMNGGTEIHSHSHEAWGRLCVITAQYLKDFLFNIFVHTQLINIFECPHRFCTWKNSAPKECLALLCYWRKRKTTIIQGLFEDPETEREKKVTLYSNNKDRTYIRHCQKQCKPEDSEMSFLKY